MIPAIIAASVLFAQTVFPPVTSNQIKDWIIAYSEKYDIDSNIPTAIADCESVHFDDLVINNKRLGRLGEVGAFQFHPNGVWFETPQALAGYSRYDQEANVAAGVWAIS